MSVDRLYDGPDTSGMSCPGCGADNGGPMQLAAADEVPGEGCLLRCMDCDTVVKVVPDGIALVDLNYIITHVSTCERCAVRGWHRFLQIQRS